MSIFVMSDIHGQSKLFYKMLETINFNDNDRLYIIGDVIDRGYDNISLLNYILNKKNIILLKGNHEQMMIDAFNTCKEVGNPNSLEIEQYFNLWFHNGGKITFEEFMKLSLNERIEILKSINEIKEFQILTINKQKYLITHAGVYYEPFNNKSLKDLLDFNILKQYHLWLREEFLDVTPPNENNPLYDYIVIFGHTPISSLNYYMGYVTKKPSKKQLETISKNDIYFDSNKIGIDCGCAFLSRNKKGKLGCLCLDNLNTFYEY